MGKAKVIRPVKAWGVLVESSRGWDGLCHWAAFTKADAMPPLGAKCYRPIRVLITPIVRKPKPRKPARARRRR